MLPGRNKKTSPHSVSRHVVLRGAHVAFINTHPNHPPTHPVSEGKGSGKDPESAFAHAPVQCGSRRTTKRSWRSPLWHLWARARRGFALPCPSASLARHSRPPRDPVAALLTAACAQRGWSPLSRAAPASLHTMSACSPLVLTGREGRSHGPLAVHNQHSTREG